MIKSIIFVTLLLLAPLMVVHSLPTIYSNYNKPFVINNVTIYKELQYKIELQKQVTQNVTKTVPANTTTTTTTVPTEVTKVVGVYIVNYTVTNISNTTIYVKISGNFTGNFTFIKQGNYSLNVLQKILSLDYPYIPPFLMFNNSYAIFTKSGTYSLVFIKSLNYTINGKNITAYEFLVAYNSSYYAVYDILNNGLLANYTTSYNGSTLIMSLISYAEEYNITLNQPSNSDMEYLSQPYLYLEYLYNPASKSLQPQNYLQVYYPFVIGNYMAQIIYLLYPQQGELLVANTINGINVNFELYLKPANDLVLTYLQTNSSTIKWNGGYFNYINTTEIKLINGSVVNALLYRNATQNATVYLYFSPTSHILLEELIFNPYLNNYSVELQFLGNKYYSINQAYVPLTSPTYTTLAYQLVNFNEGLLIAIIVTVVLSVLIILFRER